MKPQSLLLACLSGSLFAGLSISAEAAFNPYLEPITKRNVFSLGQAFMARPPQLTPPAVTLRGIARMPDGPHALLHLPHAANTTGKESLWLRGGVPTGGVVQVLQIDVSAATVKVDYHGRVQTLKLEGN